MILTTLDILYIVLSIFTSVIGVLLAIALFRLIKILGVINEFMGYVKKINSFLAIWENIPTIIIEKIKQLIGK